MDDTPADDPFIRHLSPSPAERDVQVIAAMTDGEFDEYMADLFEDIPDDEPEVDFAEWLRQSEEDIQAGRVRPAWMVFAEIADEYGFDIPGLAKYRKPTTES